MLSALSITVEAAYKTIHWISNFGTEEKLRWIMRRAILGISVSLLDKLPSQILLEDLMGEGVIILTPSNVNNRYNLVVPQILFHQANLILRRPVTSINVVEVLSGVWNSNRFKDFEVSFEVLKVN